MIIILKTKLSNLWYKLWTSPFIKMAHEVKAGTRTSVADMPKPNMKIHSADGYATRIHGIKPDGTRENKTEL